MVKNGKTYFSFCRQFFTLHTTLNMLKKQVFLTLYLKHTFAEDFTQSFLIMLLLCELWHQNTASWVKKPSSPFCFNAGIFTGSTFRYLPTVSELISTTSAYALPMYPSISYTWGEVQYRYSKEVKFRQLFWSLSIT